MDFKKFKTQFQENAYKVLNEADNLFVTDLEKDLIWDTYLNSFPESERQGFNCSSCRHFLKPFANIVAIKDNKLISMWDFDCEEPYKTVAKNLNVLVLSKPIANIFVSKEKKLGTDHNQQLLPDKSIITWNHFYLELPTKFVTKSSESEEAIMGQYRDVKNVFKRGLEELTADSVETTLELIEQTSLYRGEEFKGVLQAFLKLKKEYAKVHTDIKDNFCWINSIDAGGALSKIRNSAIGTLLTNISDGMELDQAVAAFERIMAPTNYKRPNAIATKRMIDDAQKKIEELGLINSLGRRFATIDDITVNNVLFANRDAKKAMNVFEEMSNETSINPKNYSKVEEVSIEQFMTGILPKVTSIEVLLENKHSNNLMSLIAPQDVNAPSLLKWNNNFSWSYNGEVTDSIKEKVKAAGGCISGDLRASLAWFNTDDYDIHMIELNGNEIYFRTRGHEHPSTGMLDVDMNVSGESKTPVENIIYSNKNKMSEGIYKVYVHNYTQRNTTDFGFIMEIEFDGIIHTLNYNKLIKNNEKVTVAEIKYSKNDGFSIIKSIESTQTSKEIWGIKTNQFQKVSLLMHSHNHWDSQNIGNKHYFFILTDCKNSERPRGFYNEFLNEDLLKHKRVFEILGSKMKVEESDNQLSGLGFSSTGNNSIICRVTGSFSRTIKINF